MGSAFIGRITFLAGQGHAGKTWGWFWPLSGGIFLGKKVATKTGAGGAVEMLGPCGKP